MKRGLVDLSSVIWTCLLGGKDTEFGRQYLVDGDQLTEVSRHHKKAEGERLIYVNSAQYGYELAINHLVKAMDDLGLVPRQLIIVMEGKNSKADRQAIHPAYKAGRDKYAPQYEQFNLAKEMVLDAFLKLGAQQCWQDGGVEGDDVLGYLALNLDGERYVISGDKDLAQLVGRDPNIHHYRQGQLDVNPFGDFDHRYIPVWIATVGDPGDKIPGAKGFGEAAGGLLVEAFGNEGLGLLEGLIKRKELKRLEEDVGELRELQKIIDGADGVYMSYELGRLRVEKVNTLKRPLQWKAGMVKGRHMVEHESLRKFGAVAKLVSAENYEEAVAFLKKHLPTTPYVALDIETSTPPESDAWLESRGKADGVDVFGSELTGLSLTFGANMQYTLYLTHEHVQEEGVTNLSIEQVRDFVAYVPRSMITWVHNASFELPVCFMEWGKDWASDPEYHGFLRNVRDTAIASSYADENRSKGLKDLSATVLDYTQQTYDEVTQIRYLPEQWDGKGKVLARVEEEVNGELIPYVVVRHKMNELTARHVLHYGTDDTVCTAALANHFQVIMEIEKTWKVYEEVETWPAYLTALAFVQGADFSLEHMAEMEKEDNVLYDKSWAVLRDFLIKIGYDGTRFEPIDELTPANIKRACLEITGQELDTRVRTPSKMAKLIEDLPDEEGLCKLLAECINENNIAAINEMMERNFNGEPKLDLNSPKQVRKLLYEAIGMPITFINDVTPLERQNKPELAEAAKLFKQRLAGKDVTVTDEQLALLRPKAMADDDAIQYAIAFDEDSLTEESRVALKALGSMKKVMTRRQLYYNNYWKVLHWKDGKIHASANQCAAVTRRYSMSDPNLQQLPKKGEAVRFRGGFQPHKKDAVVCSIDFTGQELRLAAERSQDANMLACYIGDKLKDIHSITAAGAMKLKWGAQMVKDLYGSHGQDIAAGPDSEYTLFRRLHGLGKAQELGKKADDLRKDSKNVNFAAQFGGRAPKLAQTLIMRVSDAQLFLDARAEMFPDVDRAAERAAEFAKKTGYALTMLGARRHLREAMLSDERGAADRAARQAWNMEIQGSAGEMVKLAMGRFWKSGALFKYDARFIAPVHDELVTSVHRDHAVEFIKLKHSCMTQPYADMKVPILASISLGPDFAEQTECGDWFIEENIRKALNDIFYEKEAA